MQALIEFIAGFVAMLAAAALSQLIWIHGRLPNVKSIASGTAVKALPSR